MAEDLSATEWWWIDYLENEMSLSLEKDLETLLKYSQEDRDSFEAFRLVREWLKASDPVGNWPVDERLKKVRFNVMQAIETMEPPGPKIHSDLKEDTKSLSV